MKLRFTIGRKIGTGFGIILVVFIVVFLVTFKTLSDSRKINDEINEVINPSLELLSQLDRDVLVSKELIKQWANVQSVPEEPFKQRLVNLTTDEMPGLLSRIDTLSRFWDKEEKTLLASVTSDMQDLFEKHELIRSRLHSFGSYTEVENRFEIFPMVENNGDIDVHTTKVLLNLGRLMEKRRAESTRIRDDMIKSFDLLELLFLVFGLAAVGGGILVAILTVRSIVRPTNQLREILVGLGRGVFSNKVMKPTNDEIGDMSQALNILVTGLKHTTDFSREVGSGNFDYQYQPLSDEDVLGHALLKMRDDLAENERILEQKVIERTEEVVRQKEEIESQNVRLEELYKDITDSIRYAKRLQESILPGDRYIKSLLSNCFVLYKPKDIVSGDFYWFEHIENKVLFAAVDCTGHGVPGAFMSIVGHNGLQQAVREHHLSRPSDILDDLDKLATSTLNQNLEDTRVRDGMDLALCALDIEGKKLEYSGAYNPLYIIRNGEILQTKADKFAIGGRAIRKEKKFTNHEIDLLEGDLIYIFSDGYADQFGGEKGKKFMYRQFRELLLSMQEESMEDQRRILDDRIEGWRGTFEQVDDILVIGVRI